MALVNKLELIDWASETTVPDRIIPGQPGHHATNPAKNPQKMIPGPLGPHVREPSLGHAPELRGDKSPPRDEERQEPDAP